MNQSDAVVIGKQLIGKVVIKIIDKKTKNIDKKIEIKNLIIDKACDLMAQCIAGNYQSRVSHIYGEHADPVSSGYVEGTMNGLIALKNDTIDITMNTGEHSTSGAEVPIIFPGFSSSDLSRFSGNVVTFNCAIDNPILDGRILIGLGLVAIVNGQETLFSHTYIPAFIINGAKEIIAHWSIEFKNEG